MTYPPPPPLPDDIEILQFPVNRDVGLNGFQGYDEQYTNTGADARWRGAKFNQHCGLFDFDTEAMKAALGERLPTALSVTFNIYPEGVPDTDVQILTVESLNDWVEGDGAGVNHSVFLWTEGTAAVTNEFARTFYTSDRGQDAVDLVNSVPWLNDEDGSQFNLMDQPPGGMHFPNFRSSTPFQLGLWQVDEFVSTPLDLDIMDALMNEPNNRGLRLRARQSGSNWIMRSREHSAGQYAAFIEVVLPTADFAGQAFIRGDSDADGEIDLTDGVAILNFLFLGAARLPCEQAADVDDNGAIEITDGVGVFNFLFLDGPAPGAPFPDCGVDSTADRLPCNDYLPCP